MINPSLASSVASNDRHTLLGDTDNVAQAYDDPYASKKNLNKLISESDDPSQHEITDEERKELIEDEKRKEIERKSLKFNKFDRYLSREYSRHDVSKTKLAVHFYFNMCLTDFIVPD